MAFNDLTPEEEQIAWRLEDAVDLLTWLWHPDVGIP